MGRICSSWLLQHEKIYGLAGCSSGVLLARVVARPVVYRPGELSGVCSSFCNSFVFVSLRVTGCNVLELYRIPDSLTFHPRFPHVTPLPLTWATPCQILKLVWLSKETAA